MECAEIYLLHSLMSLCIFDVIFLLLNLFY